MRILAEETINNHLSDLLKVVKSQKALINDCLSYIVYCGTNDKSPTVDFASEIVNRKTAIDAILAPGEGKVKDG